MERKFSLDELQEMRIELIDQYYYWLEQYHIANEAVDDISKQIEQLEEDIDKMQNN